MFDEYIPLTDSRSLTDASRTVFFALRTTTGDGHLFIPELYRRGGRRFVVEENFDGSAFEGAEFVRCASPLKALQQWAARKREGFAGTVIGITGSRGKTMVKEWLCAALAPGHSLCRSPRSYNSRIGVPLSVWRLSANNDLGIFEAGISRSGEMETLRQIIRPDIAVITNIGHEHDGGFPGGRQQKIQEKLILARDASTIIYMADDEDIARAVTERFPQRNLFGWSLKENPAASLRVETVGQPEDGRTTLRYQFGDVSGEISIPAVAHWQVENATSVMATLFAMGHTPAEVNNRMGNLRPAGTRLMVSNGINGSQIIRDDYACDLSSLSLALDFAVRRQTGDQPLTVILADLEIDNASARQTYRKAGELLRQRNVSRLIGIGREIALHFAETGMDGEAYESPDSFLDSFNRSSFGPGLILVKGNGDAAFDRLVNRLEAKTHETVLEVNLDAMVDNFNFFRSKLKPGTGLVAMVKASGYGAGSLELAKTLQAHGAAYLAVAVGDEGEELRRAGITMPIMVLNPIVLNYKQLFDNHLEPEIFSFESLREIIAEASRAGISGYPIHIKLDSGMHRLGFRKEDIPQLLDELDHQDAVKPQSVFSHLATADCLDQDEYTLSQLEYFTHCSEAIVNHFPYKVLRHVLNTAGILRFPQYQFDMARLGIGLYGIPVLNNGTEDALRPISSLRSIIIALHEWEQNETIGYGRRGVLHRPSLIATVPIGYADGFNRHCGRGNWKVAVNGHLCPTVGNICMDICMIDVTDVPGVRTGDPVVIFGPDNPATKMAEVLDTIPYECLTSVAPRVRRVYYRES